MATATARTWQSAGLASVVEILLVAGLVIIVSRMPHSQPEPPVTQLVLEQAPELPPPPPPPQPALPKPEPVVLKPVPKLLPVVHEQIVTPPPEPVVNNAPTYEAAPAPVAPPAPVVAKPTADDEALAYNSELAKAVQAVFQVPGTASAMNFKGRARVQFMLVDGKVSAITLLQTSTLGAVDRAALKAVEAARYPAPPATISGQQRTYQIWVECY